MMNATVWQMHNVAVKPACLLAGHFAMPAFVQAPVFGFGKLQGKGQFTSKYHDTLLVYGGNRS